MNNNNEHSYCYYILNQMLVLHLDYLFKSTQQP